MKLHTIQPFEVSGGARAPDRSPDWRALARGAGKVVKGVVSVFSLQPFGPASFASVEAGSSEKSQRRAGDKVNPMAVDVTPWISPKHLVKAED